LKNGDRVGGKRGGKRDNVWGKSGGPARKYGCSPGKSEVAERIMESADIRGSFKRNLIE